MLNMPMLKIEIEGLRYSVIHAFDGHNKDFSEHVADTLEKTLTEEWVKKSVQEAVNECIKTAVKNISGNYQMQRAITDLMSDKLCTIINKSAAE